MSPNWHILVAGKKHSISGVVNWYGRLDMHGHFAIPRKYLLSNTSCLLRVAMSYDWAVVLEVLILWCFSDS